MLKAFTASATKIIFNYSVYVLPVSLLYLWY